MSYSGMPRISSLIIRIEAPEKWEDYVGCFDAHPLRRKGILVAMEKATARCPILPFAWEGATSFDPIG